ncbi:hypothetical protein GQ600_27906 [Phytophthora cactorum]|nr:hypothetical protein GQ600_27906 [Phytophthora cactorum]
MDDARRRSSSSSAAHYPPEAGRCLSDARCWSGGGARELLCARDTVHGWWQKDDKLLRSLATPPPRR